MGGLASMGGIIVYSDVVEGEYRSAANPVVPIADRTCAGGEDRRWTIDVATARGSRWTTPRLRAYHADSALAAQAHIEDEVRKTVGPVRQDEGINAA